MYTLLEQLQECICKDEKYQAFMQAKKLLEKDDIHQLLMCYQDVSQEYFRMKEYEKYTDMSSLKAQYQKLKKEISETKEIQDYYLRYNELNEMLEEVTKIIFGGISEDLNLERYSL